MLRQHLIFRSLSSQIKHSAKEFAKSIAKDAQKVANNARETLKEDFEKASGAAGYASEVIDEKVRGTDKERFHAAQEAGERAEKADAKFVFSEHAENPFNKAAKIAADAKEAVKDKAYEWKQSAQSKVAEIKGSAQQQAERISEEAAKRAQQSDEGFSESHESIASKIGNSAENIVKKVEDTINSVADSVKSTAHDQADPLFHAKIDPMGGEKTPLQKPEMNQKTEELQKKGAKHKKKEDSFNLM